MKKILLLMLILTAGIFMVACNRDRSGTQSAKLVEWYELPETADLDTSQQITIKFWHRMGAASQLILQGWITEFQAVYPNITVIEEKAAADYDALADKIALSIPAGTMPDISESYPDHIARYAQAKAPLALNHFISNPNIGYTEEEIADFLPGLWAEGLSYDSEGTILSMPFTKSSEAFFYNKTYFDAKGYEVPTTWDEVFAIAELIKADEPDAIPFGYDSTDNLFITASKQWEAPYTGYNSETGRGEVLFNNDTSKEMVRYFKDKVDRGLMLTRALNGDAFTSDIMKTNQKLYMYVGSTGGTRYAYIGASTTVFNAGYRVGVAPLPAKDAEHRFQIQQGPNVSLFNSKDEQKMIASWLFVKFMLQPEKTAQFCIPSGYAPIRYSAYETDAWLNYVASINPNPTTLLQAQDKLVKEAIEIFLNNGEIFFTSAVFNLGSKTRSEVGALMTKIFAYKPSNETDLTNYINSEFQKSYDFITN